MALAPHNQHLSRCRRTLVPAPNGSPTLSKGILSTADTGIKFPSRLFFFFLGKQVMCQRSFQGQERRALDVHVFSTPKYAIPG